MAKPDTQKMALWTTKVDFSFRGWLVGSLFLSSLLLVWTFILGQSFHRPPHRCRAGFEDQKVRCCAQGQRLEEGSCRGKPDYCPPPYLTTPSGCVFPSRRVRIPGGSITLGPTDWDSADLVKKVTISAPDLDFDQSEVTYFDYQKCVSQGLCPALASAQTAELEPGTPVTNVTVETAAGYCRYLGGRLPTREEWMMAASGTEGRRFPWGPHGLVCRRASFGLTTGPCAEGGRTPELVGMRPEGGTPEGLLDLAGNVKEWTLNPDGVASVSGGSFRSQSAGALKVWSSSAGRAADDVGFRCVYVVASK